MVFVEVFRLVLVLLGVLLGLHVGRSIDGPAGQTVGMVLGALIAYVLGGTLGRALGNRSSRAVARFDRIPPGELFAGVLTGSAGLILGVALVLPLLSILDADIAYSLAALIGWILAGFGFRIGAAKGRQVIAAAGLSHVLAPPSEPPAGYALLVDASAVMDRSLLTLGRAGLLVGGLLVPRFVVDQVQTLVAGPDPVSSRRARRGLESLQALRQMGVTVRVAENELPEIDNLDDRLLEISRRLGLRLATCSSTLRERAKRRNIPVTDLRRIAADLTPDYPPGERLVLDLVKEGTQPRQAIGYLPDGDMVIVNDASHLVGEKAVVVEVLSTRITSQGLLVFARCAPPRKTEPLAEASHHEPADRPAGRRGPRAPDRLGTERPHDLTRAPHEPADRAGQGTSVGPGDHDNRLPEDPLVGDLPAGSQHLETDLEAKGSFRSPPSSRPTPPRR